MTIIHGTLGWTILAPAAREYAVLPVGVAMMMPVEKEKVDKCVCDVTCDNWLTISLNSGHRTSIALYKQVR